MSFITRCDSCNKDIVDEKFNHLTFDAVQFPHSWEGELKRPYDICQNCEYIVNDFIADLLYKNRGKDAT